MIAFALVLFSTAHNHPNQMNHLKIIVRTIYNSVSPLPCHPTNCLNGDFSVIFRIGIIAFALCYSAHNHLNQMNHLKIIVQTIYNSVSPLPCHPTNCLNGDFSVIFRIGMIAFALVLFSTQHTIILIK